MLPLTHLRSGASTLQPATASDRVKYMRYPVQTIVHLCAAVGLHKCEQGDSAHAQGYGYLLVMHVRQIPTESAAVLGDGTVCLVLASRRGDRTLWAAAPGAIFCDAL